VSCQPEPALVRPGVAGDMSRMADIERAAAIHPWSLSQFLDSSMRENEHALVSQEQADGEIFGFCIYQQVLDEATLMNVAVHPDRQGRGQGRLLMDSLLRQQLPLQGVSRCLLEVRRSNLGAIALYRHFGFVDDGVRSTYYTTINGSEDALLMSCELVLEQ
jgi:ribosomal-protein-alanine N-acetyltransferase